VAVPEEVKRATRIEGEKDRILAQAHEEADRIRELARQEAEELVARESIIESAEHRADMILERSRREAEILRQDADVYVINELAKLENDLLNSLAVVRNGLNKIQQEQPDLTPPLTENPIQAAPVEAEISANN
ncbi:MAG: hypothetical protein KDE48_15275, partial [Anaerolineales bacterium]|nr:hypothetical protein [Anaerolineales bacterium]